MEHFRVLQKSFGSYYERRKTEAFFIRILRPDLNGQNNHRYFTLFWCGQFFKLSNFCPHNTNFHLISFVCLKRTLRTFVFRALYNLQNFSFPPVNYDHLIQKRALFKHKKAVLFSKLLVQKHTDDAIKAKRLLYLIL